MSQFFNLFNNLNDSVGRYVIQPWASVISAGTFGLTGLLTVLLAWKLFKSWPRFIWDTLKGGASTVFSKATGLGICAIGTAICSTMFLQTPQGEATVRAVTAGDVQLRELISKTGLGPQEAAGAHWGALGALAVALAFILHRAGGEAINMTSRIQQHRLAGFGGLGLIAAAVMAQLHLYDSGKTHSFFSSIWQQIAVNVALVPVAWYSIHQFVSPANVLREWKLNKSANALAFGAPVWGLATTTSLASIFHDGTGQKVAMGVNVLACVAAICYGIATTVESPSLLNYTLYASNPRKLAHEGQGVLLNRQLRPTV